MGEVAVRAATAVGYLSAGTVEFLLDADGRFYFLEMNTRLQVEHPVTEVVYGVDLVREQLRIASGEPMSCSVDALHPRGHAIECRLTSEDPFNRFLPATGRVDYLHVPAGPGVRWDGGIETGSEVALFYDSLLGKLIAWGASRDTAIRRMQRALGELVIVGLPTSQAFHRRVMQDPVFLSGGYDIEYMERVGWGLLGRAPDAADLEVAAVAAALAEDEARTRTVPPPPPPLRERDGTAVESPWLRAARLRALR